MASAGEVGDSDPLRARVAREMHFRPDDTPEAKEALISAALRQERASVREALEPRARRH